MGKYSSPYKENKISIGDVLGTSAKSKKEKPAYPQKRGPKSYPNEQFASVDEYVDFSRKYGVYGAFAYAKKKAMDKQAQLLEMDVRPPRKGKQ